MARKMPKFVAKEEGAMPAGVIRGADNPRGRPGIAAAKGKKKRKGKAKKGPVAHY